MKSQNIINWYKHFVFGEDEAFNVQKKIFLLITHITLVITFVGIISNIIIGLDATLTLFTVVVFFVVLFFHTKVKRIEFEDRYALGFFIISVIVFSYMWFYNGGYDGNTSVLIFVYFIVVITILPGRFRLFSFIAYSFMITGLIVVQYFFPELILPYQNEHQRFVDLVVGYFLYLILAYSIQKTIVTNYAAEREKVKSQNVQLSELNSKITETNLKLEETVKTVGELNASKDRFISILSHDLRSPFHALLGLSRTLKDEYDEFSDDDKKHIVKQLNLSIEKLYSFLEEILLWGRLQRGVVNPKYAEENLAELLEKSINVHSAWAARKGVSINLICRKDLTAVLDKELILIVMQNLVSNAIKFSLSGNAVAIEVSEVENKIFISVSDKGVGITPRNLSRLFRIEEIITSNGTEGEAGTGMGLIICMDILKRLGGKISVQSVVGEGTTLLVELPVVSLQG